MAVKIFCCYAHEDEPLLKKLKTHLFPLQRAGLVDVWYDRDISAGTDWEQQIKERLNAAHIILLLVSPDFMASDYCYSIEMQRAMERHEKGEARVIPIILRRVLWQGAPFSKLQALPTDGKPVKSWLDEDEALFNVVKGVRKAIDELSLSKSSPINTLLEETTKQETTTPSITQSETPPIVSTTSDQVSQSNHVNSTQQSAQTNVTDLPQTLTDFDPAKQRNDEQYAEVIERWGKDIDLDNWTTWTGQWIFMSPRPAISYKQLDSFEDLDIWLNSRIWPKRYPELDAAFENFRRVLLDLVSVHYRHSTTDEAHEYSVTDKYYQFVYGLDGRKLNTEQEQRKEYELHHELLGDLMLELTRAANYICDKVRLFIDPTFRIQEGVVLVAFNWGDFRRTEYQTNERVLFPYPGLEQFMKTRKNRDLTF